VQEAAREAETFQRVAESAQAVALLDLRRRSARAASLGALMDDLAELLPALSMDAVYLALYDRGAMANARLVLAWEGGRRIPLRADGLRFEPRTLLPTSLRRRGQQVTSIAQPLQLGGRQLGYMVIRGKLYDAQLLGDVCQLLSTALARFELN
jgi:hypothetical protein